MAQASIFSPVLPQQAQCAIVGRAFNMGGKRVTAGTKLSQEQLCGMLLANYRALVENRFIRPVPIVENYLPQNGGKPIMSSATGAAPSPLPGSGERHSFMTGFGKYTVVAGTVLGSKLTKDEAEALMKGFAAKQAASVSAVLGAGPVEQQAAGGTTPLPKKGRGSRKRRSNKSAPAPESKPEAPPQDGTS